MINFNLVFGGFYGSFEEDFINENIELFLEDYNMSYEDVDININYKAIAKEICEVVYPEFIENICLAKINLKFNGLYHPREYNFESDSINASMSFKDLRRLLKALYKEEGKEKIKNWIDKESRSKDGFISFYNGFKEVKKDIDIFTGYLFQYIFVNFFDDYLEALDLTNFRDSISDHIDIKEAI